MHDFIRKLLDSKTTIIIILWVIVFSWVYSFDYKKKPVPHTATSAVKTLEEIMDTPVDNSPEPPWDNEFKSAVEPI